MQALHTGRCSGSAPIAVVQHMSALQHPATRPAGRPSRLAGARAGLPCLDVVLPVLVHRATRPLCVGCSPAQAALERAANDAMAAAVKRMNRAVEMVADAESRAAAAAAMATAYQDISDGQAAAAAAAADLPAAPARQGPAGHMANLQQVLHEQLFSVRTVLGDFMAGIWAAMVGAVAALQAVLAAAWAKLLGLFGLGGGGAAGAGAAGAPSAAGSS